VAPLIRFLVSTILFSLTSDYDKQLKEELWKCHKHMNLSMEEIYNMPRLDRKNYIRIHNKITKEENERIKRR
jgi:hypothetical protein